MKAKGIYGIKFTDADGLTGEGYPATDYKGMKWGVGVTHITRPSKRRKLSEADLCTAAVIHFYPIKGKTPTKREVRDARWKDAEMHAGYAHRSYRMYLVVASGTIIDDGEKAGATKVRAIKCLVEKGRPRR